MDKRFGTVKFGKGSFGKNRFVDPLAQLRSIGGLTFYKDYTSGNGGLRADSSSGSPEATFTSARTTSAPATYVDGNGIIQLVTTANVPRFQSGYYDTTGFHALSGLMIEGAGTNRATYSSIPENAAWTKTNVTADNDDAGSSSPDGTATAPRIVATAADGTLTQAYVDAVAGVYTASLWIKRKTGTGTINLRANTGNAYTDITTSVLSTWTRVSVSSTSLTNPTFDLQLHVDTDAVYIWGCQLEKNPYMTSLIPCPTTALTRPAEALKYAISGNRTAATESIFVKFAPCSDFANDGKARYLTATDTKDRNMRKLTTGTSITARPNDTDSNGCSISIAAPTANILSVVGFSMQQASPYATGYVDGALGNKETADNFTTPAWGTYFYIGSDNGGTNHANAVIQSIVIFNRVVTTSEALTISNILKT